MMSLMINGYTQRERVALKNKNTCLIGAVLGHVIPGANCLVWWYNVESQYTYDAWWKKFGLLALGVKGVAATSILAGIYFTQPALTGAFALLLYKYLCVWSSMLSLGFYACYLLFSPDTSCVYDGKT